MERHPEGAAVLADVAFFELVAADLPTQGALHARQVRRQIVRMGDLLEGAREQLFVTVAEHVGKALVREQPAAIGRVMGYAHGSLLEGGTEAACGAAARFAVARMGGHFRQLDQHGVRPAAVVMQGDEVGAELRGAVPGRGHGAFDLEVLNRLIIAHRTIEQWQEDLRGFRRHLEEVSAGVVGAAPAHAGQVLVGPHAPHLRVEHAQRERLPMRKPLDLPDMHPHR